MDGLVQISCFRGCVFFTRGLLEVLCCFTEGLLEILCCVVIPEVRGWTPEFSFLVGSCSQRPRFRPNKDSAHNLAIGFDPCWSIHPVPLVVSLRYVLSFFFIKIMVLLVLHHLVLSFINVYGYSSFHIYPVTYLSLLITRGHGYFFY